MNVRTRLFTVLAAASGVAGCTGGAQVTSNTQALVNGTGLQTAYTNMPLGIGYTTSSDEKRGKCLDLVKAADCAANTPLFKLGNQEGRFELELVSSRKELKDKLGIDASVSVRYKLIEGSGAVNIEQESEFTSSTITYILKGEESYWADLNDPYSPELTKAAFDKLNDPTSRIPEAFFQSCGDGWIEGSQRGAQFYALLTIEAGSKTNRDKIKGEIAGSIDVGPLKVGGKAAIDMLATAKASNAKIKLTIRARGFNWAGVAATDDLLKAALGGEVKDDTLDKFGKIRQAMQQSIANDRCFDLGFQRARMVRPGDKDAAPVWQCTNEDGPSLGQFASLLRIHVNDYAAVNNLPKFTRDWNPLRDYVLGLAQARTYITQLQFLEDALFGVFFDEIRPYQKAVAERRKEYGLAPPLVAPTNQPPGALEALNKRVDEAAAVFAPPGGRAFERVRSARLSCLNGISAAAFEHCIAPPGTPAAQGNRWIAAREPYRDSWHDLFNYRERFRVLPLQLLTDAQLRTYDDAFAACPKLQGTPRLITDDEIERAVLRLVGADTDVRQNAGWYLAPVAVSETRSCPRSWYSDADRRAFTRPVLVRGPTGETFANCWRTTDTTRMLCVPQGGLFDGYGEPLQGLMQPPPQVDTIIPAPPSAQDARPVVPAGTRVTLFFRTPLAPATVNDQSFMLRTDGAPVTIDVTYVDRGVGGRVEMIPRQQLVPGKEYTVDVAKTVTNTSGDPMLAGYQSKFRVTNLIKTVTPAADQAGVALNAKVDVVFSMPVNAQTVTAQTFRVFRRNEAIAGAVTYNAETRTATFTPAKPLDPSAPYRVLLDDIRDATSFTFIASWSSLFTTGAVITSVAPTADATGVARDLGVMVDYSGEVAQDVVAGAFTLRQGAVEIPGEVNRPIANLLQLRPSRALEPNTTYTATVTTAVLDRAGKPVLTSKTWSFTTGADR